MPALRNREVLDGPANHEDVLTVDLAEHCPE
jgi:hypothetical protein